MLSIMGIYKLPSVRHIFFIVSSLNDFLDSLALSEKNRTRKECFERILRSKDRKRPKEDQQWKVKVVCVHDFLKSIRLHMPTGKVSPNQTSHNPEELELLSINLVKTPPISRDRTFFTPKVLSAIPDDDIIEVFI